MNMPISEELIAEANAREMAALEDEYAALGRKLERRGIGIAAIKRRVSEFSVAVPSWGAGRGGTRFAKFPIAGEPTNIHEKLEDCAVINQLGRTTPRVRSTEKNVPISVMTLPPTASLNARVLS